MINKQWKKYRSGSILLLSVLFVIIVSVKAQQTPPDNQQVQFIEMRHAERMFKIAGIDADIVINSDSVEMKFYHNGAYLFADSAHWVQANNTFEAWGNVRMEQGDTLFVFAAYLHYDGNTRLARLRENVRLEDPTATLFTDSLNYDRITNLGYFFEGGLLVDDENELTSYWGQYSPETNQALFRDSVKLVNENYTIFADTLKYNTETKITDILGPSRIVSEDGVIYTSRGWYDTTSDKAMLLDRSRVYSNDGQQMLTGDTIFYNRVTGEGEVFGNMSLEDTGRSAILRGNYGFYNEKTEYGFATGMSYAVDYSQSDSLFIGGDSLFMITLDSIHRDFKAYYNVRIFRNDIQAIADSIHYSAQDSTIFMRGRPGGRPVIWNENQQVSGNEIDILMNDSTIEKAYVRGNAFAIQDRETEEQFNQLSGRNMTAFFRAGEIHHLLVEGSAESMYYLIEDDGFVIGLNRTESPYASFYFENRELDKIWLSGPADATTTPLPQLNPEGRKLSGFVWLDYLRPLNSRDIFRRNERSVEDDTPERGTFVRDNETL
jgi:lipopolysaccharide export system protein LptA